MAVIAGVIVGLSGFGQLSSAVNATENLTSFTTANGSRIQKIGQAAAKALIIIGQCILGIALLKISASIFALEPTLGILEAVSESFILHSKYLLIALGGIASGTCLQFLAKP